MRQKILGLAGLVLLLGAILVSFPFLDNGKTGPTLASVPTTAITLTATTTPLSLTTQSSLATPPAAPPTPTLNQHTAILGHKIGKISLETQLADIPKLLGEPSLRTSVHGNGSPQWEYASGLTLDLGNFDKAKSQGDIWKIIAQAPFDGANSEGLKVGDTRETFKRLYAGFEVYFPMSQAQAMIRGGDNVTLYVDFDKNDKVTDYVLIRDIQN